MARGGVGIRVVRNDLPSIAGKLPVARRVILGQRGGEIRDGAKRRSRVDTGRMREGWELIETNQGIRVENDVEYTVHNEYGTVNMPAQPMIRPSFEEVRPKIVQDFRNLEEHLQ
jgi:HK97 gp10 family phage protein